MKLAGFTILVLFQACYAKLICDDVLVRNAHYKKETLVDNIESPYQLAIDYDTRTLFFSYNSATNRDVFTSAFVNLKTHEFKTIPGIAGGFASAVDHKHKVVYLGGLNGLYKFDYNTKAATHLDATRDSIWQIFFKNNVYYSTYPKEQVYVLKNGKSERVPQLANTRAMLVALNNDLDFYFTNSNGLFKLNKTNGQTSLLGDYTANAMTADINGELYFTTPNGIYFINKEDKIEEIARIPNIYGIAIESNGNIIYASDNSIVRLNPTESPCLINVINLNK